VKLWEGSVVDRFGEDLHGVRPPVGRAEPADDRESVAEPLEPKS
jgi:hypothetical protein